VSGMRPSLGPRSGGTRVTFTGLNLDVGISRTVAVAGLPCHITRYVSTASHSHTVSAAPSPTRNTCMQSYQDAAPCIVPVCL